MNEKQDSNKKFPWHTHMVALGLPLCLMFVGGLLGGACGGLAYATSISLIKKKGASFSTYFLSILIGFAGFLAYFGLLILLATIFPDLLGE